MEKEIWKEICEGYLVSNKGNIKSLFKKYGNNYKFKKWEPKILKGTVENTGYKTVSIHNKKQLVHRLVAQAFIPNPNNLPQVNHIDGNKLNNCVDNLEWCTAKENVRHAWKIGICNNVLKNIIINKPRAKTVEQYDLKDNFIKAYKGSVEAQKHLNSLNIKINARNIRKVCNGERNTAGGYKWKYKNSR